MSAGENIVQLSSTQALQAAQAAGLDRLDAQLLLLHALGRPAHDRAWLLAHDSDLLKAEIAQCFQVMTARRLKGEPVAYLIGTKEFFGLDLRVDARVLVPRPDTETLVQWSLDLLQLPGVSSPPKVLDLGTGSGAIAVAVAHCLQNAGIQAHVVAVDASSGALDVARENAMRLQLNVKFIQSAWLREVSGNFDLIASNPPYIADGDPHLEALIHEPLEALTAGADGLQDIRQIVAQSTKHLEAGGWLLLEHGYDQACAVRDLLLEQGFMQVQSRQDLAGIERCSGGQWPR